MNKRPSNEKHLLLWLAYVVVQIVCAWAYFGLTSSEQQAGIVGLPIWAVGPSMLGMFLLVGMKKKSFDSTSLAKGSQAALLIGWPLGLLGLMSITIDAVIFLLILALGGLCMVLLPFVQNKFLVWFCSCCIAFNLSFLLFSSVHDSVKRAKTSSLPSIEQKTTEILRPWANETKHHT